MMKTLLLIIIFILIIGGIGFALEKQFPHWGIKATITNLIKQPSTKASNTNNTPIKSKQSKTMYRWQDERGQWHFGESPPANVKASPVRQNKGNTYNDRAKNSDTKQHSESKGKPALFPQFTPAH